MTDSKKDPRSLPPDDFSATTPNIKIPRQDLPSYGNEAGNDWEKTNYNYGQQIKDAQEDWGKTAYNVPVNPPRQSSPPPADDWGKTAYNINIPGNEPPPVSNQPYDPNKTYIPGRQEPQPPQSNSAREVDWGLTQANIRLPDEYNQPNQNQGKQEENWGMTTPYIRLPENEKRKYQQSAQPPPQQRQERQERQSAALPPPAQMNAPQQAAAPQEKKGGIPGWLLASGGLLAMFLFALVVLLGVYYIFLNKTGFNVNIKGAQPGSEVFVDGVRWQVSSADGSIKVQNLKAGQRRITIKKQGFADDQKDVEGKDGDNKEIIAQQRPTATPPQDDCLNIRKGDFAKAEKCAYDALDKLGNPFTVDELLRAMNLYIINFASGSANIPPANLKFLERASGYMKQLPQNVLIEVGGHTDNVGNDASNQRLSEARAKAVREALIKFGVQPEMLQTKGYGEGKPRSSNDTEDGKFQNRRIEYTAVSK